MERSLTVSSEPLLVVILGPTGSGKTALSLALAERFHGEVVNCDSVAMYREFEIGTAKPTPAERARAPHHLLDFVEPTAYITAGEYARQGREVLRQIKADDALKTLPVVILTTSSAETDIVKAYGYGAGSYLTKPVDFAKFTSLMEAFGYYWLAWNRFPE